PEGAFNDSRGGSLFGADHPNSRVTLPRCFPVSPIMAEITAGKQRGRPFRRGESGNSAGRPVGARHKATVAAETLLDGEAEGLTRKVLEMALAGDNVAMRLCLERILPPRRERPVRF